MMLCEILYIALAAATGYYIGYEHGWRMGQNLEKSKQLQQKLKEMTWLN